MSNTQTLQVTTPSDLEIVMKRSFNAPRRLVFDAMTKPDLMKRWFYGPDGWSLAVCEIDPRVGGPYRYVWRGPDGTEMGVSGVCREFVPPERVVSTEKFDDAWYPGEAIVTLAFEEENGTTTLTMNVLYETQAARDMALKSGMEHGVAMGYDRLAGLLPTFAEEV